MTITIIEQINNNLSDFNIDILVEYYLNLNKESKKNFLTDFLMLLEKNKSESLNVDLYNEETITINDINSLDSIGIFLTPSWKDEMMEFQVSINKSEFGVDSDEGYRVSKEISVTHHKEELSGSVLSFELITQIYSSTEDYALDYRNEYSFNTKENFISIESDSTNIIFHELVEELHKKPFLNKDFFEIINLKHDFKSDFITNNLIDFLNETNYKHLIRNIEQVNNKKVKNENSTNSKRRVQ